jgi:hypothetical protein
MSEMKALNMAELASVEGGHHHGGHGGHHGHDAGGSGGPLGTGGGGSLGGVGGTGVNFGEIFNFVFNFFLI